MKHKRVLGLVGRPPNPQRLFSIKLPVRQARKLEALSRVMGTSYSETFRMLLDATDELFKTDTDQENRR